MDISSGRQSPAVSAQSSEDDLSEEISEGEVARMADRIHLAESLGLPQAAVVRLQGIHGERLIERITEDRQRVLLDAGLEHVLRAEAEDGCELIVVAGALPDADATAPLPLPPPVAVNPSGELVTLQLAGEERLTTELQPLVAECSTIEGMTDSTDLLEIPLAAVEAPAMRFFIRWCRMRHNGRLGRPTPASQGELSREVRAFGAATLSAYSKAANFLGADVLLREMLLTEVARRLCGVSSGEVRSLFGLASDMTAEESSASEGEPIFLPDEDGLGGAVDFISTRPLVLTLSHGAPPDTAHDSSPALCRSLQVPRPTSSSCRSRCSSCRRSASSRASTRPCAPPSAARFAPSNGRYRVAFTAPTTGFHRLTLTAPCMHASGGAHVRP